MKRESIIFMLFSYFRERIKIIGAFLIFILIFFLVYFLYHLPMEPAFYASLLTITLAFLFTLYDFYKFYNKHMFLKYILNTVEDKLEKMPESNKLIEEDYQEIIKKIDNNNAELEYKINNNRSEMIEYYTMWVHQIKTPISALHMILQSMDSFENKKLMNQEVFKIEQYVEMVLHYLRLESMSSDLRLEEYNLKNILHQVVKKHALMFINKKIKLDLEEINYRVITDEKWLTFILEQIVSNALKYTKEGTISIYMDKQNKDTLIIKDTGIGIEEEDIPRVFEKGFTGYNGRMNKKSTGIGLYLCKNILNNLSHKIFITSQVGKGTMVTIDFSRKKIEIE